MKPEIANLLKQMGFNVNTKPTPPKKLQKNPDPFPKTIPECIFSRYNIIHDLCADFSKKNPELEMEKPVSDLLSLIARIPYTTNLLKRGTEPEWASGFIYAIGQMKGIFTRGREEGWKARHIGDFFGVKSEVPQGRAYLIRTELRDVKRSWNEKYEGTIFDGQVDDDWAECMNEWVGEHEYLRNRGW